MHSLDDSFINSSNIDFIDSMLRRWLSDGNSVDKEWRDFFGKVGETKLSSLKENLETAVSKNDVPEHTARANVAEETSQQALLDSIRAIMLIRVYRVRGHLQACLDPLGLAEQTPSPELDPASYGFKESDYDRPIFLDGSLGLQYATLKEIIDRLKTTYCAHVGVEFMHMQDPAEKAWIQEQMEASGNRTEYSSSKKLDLFDRLTAAEGFEKFLAAKFMTAKRFGLEGAEAMIPALEAALLRAAEHGMKETVIGMAHRGRLNVLANMLGKPFKAVLAEFNGVPAYSGSVYGSGDVKYHLGASTSRIFGGSAVHMTLCANPSHLEWINPVVLGRVRAKQQKNAGSHALSKQAMQSVMAVLIHGDAAFAGQGIVGETLTLSSLKGYRIGGTLHFIINNQVGFTTSPRYSRSGSYCSDIAKSIQAPIFHVNGDDVEALAHVCELAAEFRQRFNRDAVIDMVCYRRHGHNESDEPAFTQPIMYKTIKNKTTTREIYADKLINDGLTNKPKVDEAAKDFAKKMEEAFHESAAYKYDKSEWTEERSQESQAAIDRATTIPTGVDEHILKRLCISLSQIPESFNINPKIARQLEARREIASTGQGIDWSMAEALAFGSLLLENTPIRLSGQDSRRGTFSQRHSVLVDQTDEHRYTPLNNLGAAQAYFDVHDSPLSEAAVMGFDYGFSISSPETLVCWEAQFGDFANTAQVFIDQFLSSSESKWMSSSGIVLMLPHGYEGQGPEHSSARLERYLQLCAEENIQVANCSTPANYFHILRRQVLRKARKPLVLMTPKSLLRHKMCVSDMAHMALGSTFMCVLPDPLPSIHEAATKIRRIVLCSGKVFYDLMQARTEQGIKDTAIIRLEQLYPFPEKHIANEINKFPSVQEIVWCQEEPENMGAWNFIDRRMENLLHTIGHSLPRLRYVGRPEAASPASGSLSLHTEEQNRLVYAALAPSV